MFFCFGFLLGGLVVHLWWRRWNRRRRIKIDTTDDSYFEMETAPGGTAPRTL